MTFSIFAVVCALGFVFVGRFVPESRNRNYAEVDADLKPRWGQTKAAA